MIEPSPDYTLLTFGPMIDSELSRFVLWRYAVPYREERHIFGWVSLLTLIRAGTPQIPVLLSRKPALVGPRAMIDHFEKTCPPDRALLPARQPLRSKIEANWDRFNGQLAAETAKFAYFHLLPHPDILTEPFCRGIPAGEAKLTPTLYPLLRRLFTLLLQLSPAAAADALLRIRIAVDAVDKRLTDGRKFLHGDDISLADVALATAIAPLVLPPFYTAPIPPFESMPEPLKDIIAEFRTCPTGLLTERVYALRGPTDAAAPLAPRA